MDVVVPVYNNSKYLIQCLDSLTRQSSPFDSIVVVDDASTDPDVSSILESYSRKTNSLTIITHDANCGISAAQNSGLARCRADLVAFVDCDDFIAENAVEEISRAISDMEPAYTFTDRVLVNGAGEYIKTVLSSQQYEAKHSVADALLDGMFASHLKVIARQSLLAVGGFASNTNGIQDWDLALKISETGKFFHVKQPLYFHRIHADQHSTRERTSNFKKTNNVRRLALQRRGIRREAGHSISGQLRIVQRRLHSLLLTRWREDNVSFLEIIGSGLVLVATDSCLGVFHLNEVLYNTEFVCPQNSVLMIIAAKWADLGQLRFVKGITSAHVTFVPVGTPDSCCLMQWFNSYFETVAPLTLEAEIACLGFLWDGAELLGSSDHEKPSKISKPKAPPPSRTSRRPPPVKQLVEDVGR